MAGSEKRGSKGAGGSGEAQAQGQPRDSAMAPMQPSLGPPRDEPRVFGLDKFNGDNFAEWSFKMENIFDHYDLLEVMEGTEKRSENDPEKSPWVRKSAQGYLLLGQALGSSQIRHIKPFQPEPEKRPKAWAALKGVHAPATAAVAVVLERQMAALRIEEDEAVEEGVQKFFDLLTRLEGADLNYSELQKKTKLLALLPESWSSLIINLNRDLPRLSLEDVKRAILQEDFRRRELASADGAGAASIGRGYGRGRGRGRGGSRFGSNNFSGGRGSGGYGSDNKSYGRGRGRFDGECHYCHRSGHMWRDCYKLPDGWTPAQGQEGRGAGGGRGRGRGGRGDRGGGVASMKSAGNESESRDDRFPDQFFFVSTQASAGPEKDEGFEEPAAVGKVTLHSLDYWVIDSGATYSMTPRADLLTELEPSPVKHVTSALGQRAEVKGMGKAMFKGADGKMVGLKNMLWVPNLAANLISVRRLQKAGMDTSSKGAKTYTARLGERILWDLHEDRDVYNEMWQILVVPMPKERQVAASISTKGEAVGSGDGANGRAKEIESKKCNLGGTSKLDEHEEIGAAAKNQHKDEENPMAAPEEEYGENMWGTIASAAFSNPTSAMGECDRLTLHRRMGHVALPILQQLVKNEMVAGIRVKGEPDEVLGCPTCMQAKFTRYPFSSSEATAKAPLDEVVMDVVGPLKLGAAGAEYFLTIVDVYTRMTWVYVLSKKSDVAETVKTDWLPMVERQQDRLVKAIRTDRGGKFLSKEFSLWQKKNGIRHSLTMPYSPALNGIAERANRTITETARGLLIEAGLPDYFWADAVRSACVAKNRALTHVGAHKWVPYVEWIGRKPKVDMLRVFGCMCMALVPKHLQHNKLDAKAIWAVHLGMAQNSKRWLLWDPFTKKFLVSRDCKFMENLMYKDWKAKNEAKIGMRFGEVRSSGLEHVELPLELSSGSTTTRQSSLMNGGEEAKDAEEEEEEVQQVSERAPTLPSRTTSAPRIRVTPQQRQGLHVPAAEEEGRGKRRIQAPNRLTYDALGKPAKSALAGAALMVEEDEESDYEECAFAFFSPVEMPGEPATLKEALESSDAEEWKKAMESELKSIEENDTWELVELPEGRKAITSKWLFKIKSDADGKIERYKSRLVVKGYQQKEKVDYKELFAPVVKPTTLRTLLAGAAIKGWVVKQMDVTTAFLNGVLEEEIFMAQPERFDDGSGRVLRLKKALYGLKQAPEQWYLKLRGVLEEIGFTPSTVDHSLFMLAEGEQRSFMVVYVDDILIFSPSSDLVKEVMLKLQDKFKCKALGDVSFYLGLHIERDVEKRCMRVHQRKYLEALAANFGQSEGHVATPFASGFKCVKGPEEESVGEEEMRRFHSLVGSLILTVARLLATAVTDPSFESAAACALVAELLDFAAACRLDYAFALVAESVPASPLSVGGECALGTDVLEDRQEVFECLVAAIPRFASLLLAPEGDPDAPDIPTPRSYVEAITGPYSSQWQAAMDVEMASSMSTGTYVEEVPPPGANIVDSIWIFRVKRPSGSPPAIKARYVARGFSQRQGVDNFQTFSPNPTMNTLWVLLHGSRHEEIWLRRPPGSTGTFPAGTLWSLRRPVYGLRLAPREWHDTLRTTLAALGFAPSTADPSLFLRIDTSLPPFYVLVYVVDLVFSTADNETLTLVKSFSASASSTPLSTSHSLSAPPSDKSVDPSCLYPELVGCLMYLMTCTRLDLAYPHSLLVRYAAPGRHRKVHWDAAKRVLRYLCSTLGMGLVLGGRGPVVLTGHADASSVDDSTMQRSLEGYTFSLGSSMVSWRSTRSSSVLSSSCEAEIYAGAMAAQELHWLTYLLTDLGEQPRLPPQRGQLRLLYMGTRANTADVFTKALLPGDHQRFVTVLGLLALLCFSS
ncbi:unnamed protein product [Closterium sp. NIES-53]